MKKALNLLLKHGWFLLYLIIAAQTHATQVEGGESGETLQSNATRHTNDTEAIIEVVTTKDGLSIEVVSELKSAKDIRVSEERSQELTFFEEETLQALKIIDVDDQQEVKSPELRGLPYTAIAQLQSLFPNGSKSTCTGTFISKKHVLTSAHCVFNPTRGGEADAVEVIPARGRIFGRESTPFGRAFSLRIFYRDEYTDISQSFVERLKFDYAVIEVNRDIGSVGQAGNIGLLSLKFPFARTVFLRQQPVNIVGYPGIKGNTMFEHAAPIAKFTDNFIAYQIDTLGGQSGAIVWLFESDGFPAVVAIHRGLAKGEFNLGIRITERVFNNILDWVNQSL